jgi:hypothetical protein
MALADSGNVNPGQGSPQLGNLPVEVGRFELLCMVILFCMFDTIKKPLYASVNLRLRTTRRGIRTKSPRLASLYLGFHCLYPTYLCQCVEESDRRHH